MPAVSDYDLIIIDEAHRGYLLDKEMGDTELLYRDQRDYQSKYRSVIEYFDAVKIALTATPALQTTEIFGQPVSSTPIGKRSSKGIWWTTMLPTISIPNCGMRVFTTNPAIPSLSTIR